MGRLGMRGWRCHRRPRLGRLLYVWRWDDGRPTPLLVVDPVPSPLEAPEGDGREATSISWFDPGHVAIAPRSGDAPFLSIGWDDVRRRLEELAAALTP